MEKKNKKWRNCFFTLCGAVVAVVVILLAAHPKIEEPTRKTTVAMGAVVSQTLYGPAQQAEQAALLANEAIALLEQKISWRLPLSEVAQINTAAGVRAVSCSQTVFDLLTLCKTVSQTSGGAFTPCLLGVTSLWDFDAADFVPPIADAVASAVVASQSGSMLFTNQTVQLTQTGMGIDLGAVGKGAACDEALNVYRQSGLKGAIISVGGSVGVFGSKANGEPWKIGVRDPNAEATQSLGTLAIQSGCVSTSGTYEKRRELNGVVYHHILDPQTGFPAQSDFISATVVCQSGALSDALATACIVLGKDRAEALLKQYKAAYLLIDADRVITVGGGAEQFFTLSSDQYSLRLP